MHPEAITSEQKKVFNNLKNFPEYYLAGGTALALQIGHRISVDFDLFSPNDLPDNLLKKIRKIFKVSKIKVQISHSEQLTLSLNGAQLTFVRYPYPLIFKLITYQGVKFLSVPEIAATKAYTVGRRPNFKNYVDLYFILKEKFISLPGIINICEKKYKDEFNDRLFLEQLVYLEDVIEAPIQFLKKPVTKEEMLKFFEKEIKKLKL